MIFNRVKETTSTTGTGDLTLSGAMPRHLPFPPTPAAPDDKPYTYVIENGDDWEIATGTRTGDVLTRTTISSSNNNNEPLNLSGESMVFLDVTAEWFNEQETKTDEALQIAQESKATVEEGTLMWGDARITWGS